jgi:hypothetical protein
MECKKYAIMEASSQISEEDLRGQAMCGRSESLQAAPERTMNETVKVNPELVGKAKDAMQS